MKEQIYTIPVNEAYNLDCECPLCELEKKLERETLDYALGAAMMEPDFREESNKTGFCSHHFSMLFDMSNKLPLALVLDTHLEEIRNKLQSLDKHAKNAAKSKGGLFKKNSPASEFASQLSGHISDIENGCIVCNKINKTMERYADVLLYMWAKDSSFKEKFEKSKGLCLRHAKLLCDNAINSLSAAEAGEFLSYMYSKEISELERIQADIHKFTLKFDYRNKDMDWGTAQDAPIRTIEKISGYIKNDYQPEK